MKKYKKSSSVDWLSLHYWFSGKHDLIVEKNLKKKLLNHGFDIQKFWNRNPENKFREISNGAINIKK